MIPVITIDGPAAAGKGTIAQLIAQQLGFHYLASGLLYRLLAFKIYEWQYCNSNNTVISLEDIFPLAMSLEAELAHMTAGEILSKFADNKMIYTEIIANIASKYAVFPEIRAILLTIQRNYKQLPGLVAEGRDMGNVIFPDANIKIFLEADIQERAKRRLMQLHQSHKPATLEEVALELLERDLRDCTREISPLCHDASFYVLDSTNCTIENIVLQILDIIFKSEIGQYLSEWNKRKI